MAGTTNVTKLAGDAMALTAETMRKVESQARQAMDTATQQTKTVLEKAPMDQMTQMTDGLKKSAEDSMEFNRGNIEAFTRATQTYMAGLQDISRQALAMMQGMGEQAMENSRALASVKSLKEAAELNTSFAKSALEKSVAETTRLNEAAFKLAEQAAAPLAARWTLAMEKMAKPISRA